MPDVAWTEDFDSCETCKISYPMTKGMKRVVMIGTETCGKCKLLSPILENICKELDLSFEHYNVGDCPANILDILKEQKVNTVPAVLVSAVEDLSDRVIYLGIVSPSILRSKLKEFFNI